MPAPTAPLPPAARTLLHAARQGPGPVVVLTGAGISAESGIPTFRGADGFWTVGSRHFRAEQLATMAAFSAMPAAIWGWYLYRRGLCLAAAPNAAHLALVELERALGDRFVLVTQNVDGLHLRAGSSAARTLQVHGNLHFARCAGGCPGLQPLPEELGRHWDKARVPEDAATLAALHCPRCGAWLRPHVLWFDECYDEANYRYDSAQAAGGTAALLLVVGTSGATHLPDLLVRHAFAQRTPLVVANLEDSPFAALAAASPAGVFLQGPAATLVPAIGRELAAG